MAGFILGPIKSNSIVYNNGISHLVHIVILLFQFLNIFGWLVAATLACLVLYGQYDDLNGTRFTREVGSLYITVHRTVWGACVAWVIFACANGYGGKYDKNTESKSILQTIIILHVPNVSRVCGLSILDFLFGFLHRLFTQFKRVQQWSSVQSRFTFYAEK